MTEHTPWRNPPLQEAIFEIRFPAVEDYAIFAGGMAVELREQFPDSMKLATAELPEFIRVEGVVKHRFFTQDQAFLFQTGIDVVSVNVISYSSFKVFIDKIKTVLVSVQKLVSPQSITRLSIRYINKFSRTSQPFLSLNIKPPFSDIETPKSREIIMRHVKQEEDDVTLAVNITYPINETDLILDIDAFHASFQVEWDLNFILDWSYKAHDVVWRNFENLVSDLEKGARQ